MLKTLDTIAERDKLTKTKFCDIIFIPKTGRSKRQ